MNKKEDMRSARKRSQDQPGKNLVNALLALVFVSGFMSTWLEPFWRLLAQWGQLAHLLLGVVAVLPVGSYLWQHFVSTLGARKPLLLATGLLTLAPMLWLFMSGFYTLIFGNSENYAWLPASHTYASYILLTVVVVHLVLYLPTAKKQAPSRKNKYSYLYPVGFVFALVAISFTHNLSAPNPLKEIPDSYSLTYGNNPFAPSQNSTPNQSFIELHAIADSRECGSCHLDIYNQWSASIHSQAASDPTYVANINLLEQSKGIEATRYCEGCHAPVALLTGGLTPGGAHGGNPESPAHMEGVSCTSCHRITSIEHTEGTASFGFEPAESEFIANPDSPITRLLNNLVLNTDTSAHKIEMADPALYTAEMCATCHEQFMDESMNNWGYVTMQHLYSNWLESPFSGQSDQEFATHQQMNCQSCHMPLVAANDPSADSNGMVRSHDFPGSNTAIPWLNGDTEQLETVQRFMQAGRISMAIEPVPRSDSPENQSAISSQLLPEHAEQLPYFLYLNETANIGVSVTNRLIGHNFPAGTTDLNEVWIEFTVRDVTNELIYQSGGMDDQGLVDANAYFYKSVPVDRRGEEVWRHDLFNMVGNSYSNLIEAGETDIKNYQFSVPSWAKGPISIDARVKYRKFNSKYAAWALPGVEDLPITELAQELLQVPLYERAPVVTN